MRTRPGSHHLGAQHIPGAWTGTDTSPRNAAASRSPVLDHPARDARHSREPLRGQLRIALNNGVTKDEIVDLFIHLEAYAGAARAFDSYQIALEIFAETTGTE